VKLLIYGINYSPELTGIGKYTGEMASWLAARGHQVRVVAAPPYYPQWQITKGYSPWLYKKEEMDAVSVTRCPVYVPYKPSALKRILHLASFALSSLPILLSNIFWKPDIVIVIEPPFFCAPATLLFSRISGAKSWLHIQDFEIDAAFDLGLLSSSFLKKTVYVFERKLLKMFHRISTISLPMLEKLKSKGIYKDKVTLFPNWVNTSAITPLYRISEYRKKLGIPESFFVALYSGNMGEKQGIEILVEAAQKLSSYKDVVFVICGQGAARARLERIAEGRGKIYWLPLQPSENLNELLNLADVHLLPQKSDSDGLVMPSKLTGMLASGKPVIATVDAESQIAEVLESSGIISPPGQVDGLCAAIREYYENPEKRVRDGAKAREYAVAHMSEFNILESFEQCLHQMSDEQLKL